MRLWQVNLGPLYRARPGDSLATLGRTFGVAGAVLQVPALH